MIIADVNVNVWYCQWAWVDMPLSTKNANEHNGKCNQANFTWGWGGEGKRMLMSRSTSCLIGWWLMADGWWLIASDLWLVLAFFKYSIRTSFTPVPWQGCFCATQEDLIEFNTQHSWTGALAKHQLWLTLLHKPTFMETSYTTLNMKRHLWQSAMLKRAVSRAYNCSDRLLKFE